MSIEHRTRRTLTILAVAGAIAVPAAVTIVSSAMPAYAYTVLCSGTNYTVCTSAGYTDHGYGASSANRYWGADPGHNCTNYAAFTESTVNGAPAPSYQLGNAATWGTNAQSHGVPVNGTPARGSVAWWNSTAGLGTDGHVAYVEAVSGSPGSFTITLSEDAASNGPFDWMKISQGDSRWPTSFIHFKDLPARSSDFNNDGRDDVAWHQGSTLFMLAANGSGFNVAGSSAGIGTADWAGVGINDNTGTPEVYWYQSQQQTIYVLAWNGSGWSIVGATSGIGLPDHAVVGNFTGSGLGDIAWHQGTTLFLLKANGNGGFTIAGSSGNIGTPDWAGAGSNDGSTIDGVYWHQNSTLYVLKWGGSGWGVMNTTANIGTPTKAVTGDFNGDGKTDIAWYQGTTLYLLAANGSGFGIVGSSGNIGTPDWAGAGSNDGATTSDVYWHQGSTIFVLRWGSGGWGVMNSTANISSPDMAVSAG